MANHLSLAAITTLLDDTVTTAASTVVTGATNATPIVVASTAHGLVTNDWALVAAVAGNTNANGVYKVEKVDDDHVKLLTRAGNSAYTSGGTIAKLTLAGLLKDAKPADIDALQDAMSRMNVVRNADRTGGTGETSLGSLFVQQP